MRRGVRTNVEGWPLATPFSISRGVKTVAEVSTVELREGEAVGRGEAVPYARYGESSESVIETIREIQDALAGKITRSELASLLPPGAARNAVDCALWDLEAALAGGTLPGASVESP